jgi:hypothetical protein
LSPCLLQPSASVKDVDRMTATIVVFKYFILFSFATITHLDFKKTNSMRLSVKPSFKYLRKIIDGSIETEFMFQDF